VLAEGDGNGRIFSFPIPTYSITENFPWKTKFGEKLLNITAKYGIPYFSNFINSDFRPEDVRSMCCRLRINKKEVIKKMGGLFGSGDLTGSIGVVTLNLPRMAYLANNKREFFDLIEAYSGIASEYLEIKRKIINKNLNGGLLPWTKRYLKKGYNGHFSTIGLVGGHEACMNLLGEEYGIDSAEGKSLMVDTLNFLLRQVEKFQLNTRNLYNLESTPAEGCTRRFINIDKKEFKDIIQSGENIKYYTNSTTLPVNKKIDVIKAVLHQSDLQTIYTGGTVFHSYLGENVDNVETIENYIKKVFTKTKIPYLTITPIFSICCDHGYISGEHFKCPDCGKETEVYSRVVGYYRAISSWNDSKQEEYKDRQMFNLNN
jgi:ribonucleoside-triphosphate reductase